jgi:hypothetical protein
MKKSKSMLLLAFTLALAACGKERTSSGPICVNGECTADVYVACFATDEVKGVKADLSAITATLPVDDGPIALAFGDGGLWASHSLGAPTLVRLAPGAALKRVTLGGGGDLEEVRVAGGLVYTTNSSVSTLAVVDPARGVVVDEVPLKTGDTGVFPQGFDLDATGTRAYVALYGSAQAPSYATGQEITVVDVSTSRACATPPCGQIVKRISLQGVPGAADADGFPFPSRVLRVGSRIYVTLSNLKLGSFGFYTDPAGNGRLAVIDPTAGDSISIVDLGSACKNPGALAADGATVYVSCASDPSAATGVVVPVNGTTPGTAIPVPVFAGQIAMCKGAGYVTDQFSGKVVRFTPQGQVAAPLDVCSVGTGGFAWASDVECGP